jgi:peroxin-10
MSTTTKAPPPPSSSSPYPFASAPDIIRAHQKDAYFQGVLTHQLSDLQRRLLGARSSHAWASEARTAADLLYLSLTVLPGNRTLGEEYCDLVQVETSSSSSSSSSSSAGPEVPLLPSLPRRAALIALSTLLPYLSALLLPHLRSRLRRRLQSNLSLLAHKGDRSQSPSYRIQRYLLAHLHPLTSGSHFQALTLAIFYFSGAYYTLSKRLLGLRYVFTTRRRADPGGAGDTVGYEVLGVLLVVQMAVRAALHVRATLRGGAAAEMETEVEIRERAAVVGDVSLDGTAYASNTELLAGGGGGVGSQRSLGEIGAATHTPVAKGGTARFDLRRDEKVMGWIRGREQRKCTFCLEGLKDPAAIQCGHVFCWSCIGDWVRETPKCPLCRSDVLPQHILPLRTA